jgi:glutathione synthase/RimK-type ligase-like ATP-grasp enzyme
MIVLIRNSKNQIDNFQLKFFETFKFHKRPIVVLSLEELKQIEVHDKIDLIIYRHAQLTGEREFFNILISYLNKINFRGEVVPGRTKIQFYEDKIVQNEIFSALSCQIPKTQVVEYWNDSLQQIDFPVVVKIPFGAGSIGVEKVESLDAFIEIDHVIRVKGIKDIRNFNLLHKKSLRRTLKDFLKREKCVGYKGPYILQEFLVNSKEDTRVTIIGGHAVVFNRGVRAGDWRASGSGNINYEDRDYHSKAVIEAFRIAMALQLHVLAVDFVIANSVLYVIEISVSFADYAVAESPLIFDTLGNKLARERVSPQKLITEILWQ